MIVGIPRERFIDEKRVSLSPAGVRSLIELGATVYVEHLAGTGAGWNDEEYEKAGATIAHEESEIYGRADLLLKVLPLNPQATEVLREDQIILSFLMLPLAERKVFDQLIEQNVTAIALENVEKASGGHPIRRSMSEIAGPLAIEIGAQYLRSDHGGRGVLMGGVPGVPPASVGILGAGVVGRNAAKAALNMGAHVILLDQSVDPLRHAIRDFGSNLQTAVMNPLNLEKLCNFVDVLVTAVLVEDLPTPHLLTRDMIRSMKNGAIFIDVAIDQGGSAETSRPTTISEPIYEDEGVLHYAVPNIPALVPRTSTRAFQAQVLPLVKQLLREGLDSTLKHHPYLSSGLNLYKGQVTRESVGLAFNTDWRPVKEVLG